MKPCPYCGYGPFSYLRTNHWWSCPKNPEMLELKGRAERIANAIIKRHNKIKAKQSERGLRFAPNLERSARRNGQKGFAFAR